MAQGLLAGFWELQNEVCGPSCRLLCGHALWPRLCEWRTWRTVAAWGTCGACISTGAALDWPRQQHIGRPIAAVLTVTPPARAPQGFLRNHNIGLKPPATGADDFQANCAARLAPLVAAFAGDARLMEVVEMATRVTQNTDAAVAWACTGAAVLEGVILGKSALQAVKDTKRELTMEAAGERGEQLWQRAGVAGAGACCKACSRCESSDGGCVWGCAATWWSLALVAQCATYCGQGTCSMWRRLLTKVPPLVLCQHTAPMHAQAPDFTDALRLPPPPPPPHTHLQAACPAGPTWPRRSRRPSLRWCS